MNTVYLNILFSLSFYAGGFLVAWFVITLISMSNSLPRHTNLKNKINFSYLYTKLLSLFFRKSTVVYVKTTGLFATSLSGYAVCVRNRVFHKSGWEIVEKNSLDDYYYLKNKDYYKVYFVDDLTEDQHDDIHFPNWKGLKED